MPLKRLCGGQTDGWMYGWTDGQMDELTDRQTNGPTEKWLIEYLYESMKWLKRTQTLT